MLNLLTIGFGGFLGSICRYLISSHIHRNFSFHGIPLGTLFVNVSGSFLIALFFTVVADKYKIPGQFVSFFATGFLGAFTTFSTFAWEHLNLFKTSRLLGMFYLLLTFFLTINAAWAGYLCAKKI